MKTTMFCMPTVHLPTEATIKWGEPHFQAGDYPDAETWVVKLEIRNPSHACYEVTYFGTEAQIRAIAEGYQAAEATDPAQLDALEDPKPEPLSARIDMVDLATRVVGMGAVKSW